MINFLILMDYSIFGKTGYYLVGFILTFFLLTKSIKNGGVPEGLPRRSWRQARLTLGIART